MPRLGSWIEPSRRRHLCAPGRRLGRPLRAQSARAGHPRPCRSRARRPRRGVADARNAGDHGRAATARRRAHAGRLWRDGPGRRGRRAASCPRAMCSDRRRSCSNMPASEWSCRATTSAAPTRPARRSWSTPCDIFITEATFGLPVFRHPPTRAARSTGCSTALHADPARCVLVGAYALGKAQRVIAELRERGPSTSRSISTARWSGCAGCTRSFGVELGELRLATGATKAELARARSSSAPPGALNDRWSRRPARSGHGDGLGLDAHPPARPPAQRRAAAGHFRPRRLGRADPAPSARSRRRSLDHPRPRGSAACTGA